MKKLAICIPTYNRKEYLQECINSILLDVDKDNLSSQIEICISDNCSTDDTESMVGTLSTQTDVQLIYHRNIKNLGPDLNYLKCIAIASAQYCWFMGSDDAIVKGSIKKIIDTITGTECAVYLSDRINSGIDLRPKNISRWFRHNKKTTYHFDDSQDVIAYFNSCYSLGAVFSFLSTIIFKKIYWDNIIYDSSYTGTAYPHVYILLSLLKEKESSSLKFILDHQFVYSRLGNDHFSTNGKVKRFMIDIDGYYKLATDLYQQNITVQKSFLSILPREHGYKKIIFVRGLTRKSEWLEISKKLRLCYYNKQLLYLLDRVPDVITVTLNSLFWKIGLKILKRY